MNLNFSDIKYFQEVCKTKNITRAAERLGITQPSLSAALKRLESALNCQLLIRSRTGINLTKAGNEFLVKSRHFLTHWEQLKAGVNKNESEVSGDYIIGAHPSLALYSFPLFLPKLTKKFNSLNLKLVHDLSRKISEKIISYQIDIGLVVNPVKHPDLVIKELFTDKVMFYRKKSPTPQQNLSKENGVLICDPDLAQSQSLLNNLKKKKLRFKRIITSSSLEVITELTASGAGVGIIPSRVATKLEKQVLTPYYDGFPVFNDRICLVYRPETQKSLGAKTIIETIKKELL